MKFPRVSGRILAAGLIGAGVLAAVAVFRLSSGGRDVLAVPVQRGTLTVRLTVTGTLKPVQSITYRSPLASRETEIMFLVPEGTRVAEGDLVARLDATELQRELNHTIEETRQAKIELQMAEIEWQAAQAVIESLSEGEGALSVSETAARLQLSQRKVDRLRAELGTLKPLFERGFITREELNRTTDALEQAEGDLGLDRQRASVLVEQTRPRENQRAELQLAQKTAQRDNVRARLHDAEERTKVIRDQIEGCSMYARRPGLVVYEEFVGASPRRKIRVGDRVTASQGLITIPDLNRMLLETSTSEADVHRLRPSQRADIRLEAFPDLRLTGRVARVGTLASALPDRSLDEKRFELVIEIDRASAELRPEMTARADIHIAERSAVLLVPVNAIFERDGSPVCHVVRGLGVETRAVQLGESGEFAVEVISGLGEGERVMLIDPGTADASAAGPSTSSTYGLKANRDQAERTPGPR